MKTIQAHYENWSEWDLDDLGIDITKVHKWYIKYDYLNIQREENGEWEEFEGSCDGFDYKRPDEITIGTPDYSDEIDYSLGFDTVENGESIKGVVR